MASEAPNNKEIFFCKDTNCRAGRANITSNCAIGHNLRVLSFTLQDQMPNWL